MHFFINIFLVLCMMIGTAEAQNRDCIEQCNALYGAHIGQSFLTTAYSNCSGNCVSHEKNNVSVNQQQPLFTGMKWQCVEYVRRWLIENKGFTFPDVTYAYQIWDLPFAEQIDTHQHIPFLHFKNKVSKTAPHVGDLLINSVDLAITGHVAVVVGVDRDSITIAEQNYFNRPWDAKNYSRRLLLDKDTQGRYRVIDEALIGWVGIRSKNDGHMNDAR